jgi:hypothetical protein
MFLRGSCVNACVKLRYSVLQCVAVRCMRVPMGWLPFIRSLHRQVSFVNELCFGRALLSMSVVQCVAVCCSVLQCVAVCCSVPGLQDLV